MNGDSLNYDNCKLILQIWISLSYAGFRRSFICETPKVPPKGKPQSGAKHRIAFLHNGISQGQVKVPEPDGVIPGAFGMGKGIRIKFKEIEYESILIGGMPAGAIR